MNNQRGGTLALAIANSLLLFIAACNTATTSNPNSPSPANTTAPAKSGAVTTFKCVQQSSGWATLAERGNAISKGPLITWNSTEFGADWTPQQRCYTVSQKLTEAVAKNGGSLNGLNLTTGKVDSRYTVVCVLMASQTECDRQNMLFTLNQKNAKNPNTVLAEITKFANAKAGNSPVAESGGATQYIPLEFLVNRLLPADTTF
jgi:Circadian oscillating protein COP23